MRRLILLSACALTLTACGTAVSPSAALRAPGAIAAKGAPMSGVYLAVNFTPTAALEHQAAALRQSLGFVDMAHAVPPRSGDALHVTVGYFQKLAAPQASALAARYRGRTTTLTVDGWGVANRQVAYFTIAGVAEDRQVLQGLKLAYEADDPHVTFGVSPANPRDVHNVPKKAQSAINPVAIEGEYHLMQGRKQLW